MSSPVPYPVEFWSSSWSANFKFPDGFKKDLLRRLPNWKHLEKALERDDEDCVWEMLLSYLGKLENITPNEVVKASLSNTLDQLVERAREARRFKRFLSRLEVKFFPEEIERRKKEREDALRSWEY